MAYTAFMNNKPGNRFVGKFPGVGLNFVCCLQACVKVVGVVCDKRVPPVRMRRGNYF